MQTFKIYFDKFKPFEAKNIKPLMGICGLYFICLKNTHIPYPFKKSKLIYIGMSEKKTNSIGKRLLGHFEGSSGNEGITNYRKVETLYFTYLNFETLKNIWNYRIEDLESYFILDFLKVYGVYPICNNKSGFEIKNIDLPFLLDIDWAHFEKEAYHGK
ncbi:MAG: hypothetical protein A2879_00810 [Omnitrophica WOR_2 bacterium RIFCSPHIGHO2_01_FULL_49_10]|nr:MAG: hypothetical protein A2879_00810 [Omnitrophica WOR_2 bacterium RIFCSPHIGHO2_01_FULL_49_10]